MQRPEQIGAKEDKRCRVIHDMYQDDECKEVATQEFSIVRYFFFQFQ